MSEHKNNNSFLGNTKTLIAIIIAIASIAWGLSATVNTTQTQVVDLKAQQEKFVSSDLFNAHLVLWDKRFQIMENQLNGIEGRAVNIERLLMEQKK